MGPEYYEHEAFRGQSQYPTKARVKRAGQKFDPYSVYSRSGRKQAERLKKPPSDFPPLRTPYDDSPGDDATLITSTETENNLPDNVPGNVPEKAEQVQVVSEYTTPIIAITAFFGALFIIIPFFIRKGPNRGIIRFSVMMSLVCMWIFWVTVYIGQMNPLMGPRLHNTTVAWIAYKLGNPVKTAAPPEENLPEEPEQEGGGD